MPSSFTSPVPGSAIWTRGGSQECRATGRAVLSDLRAGLIWESRAAMDADAESAAVQAASDDAGVKGWDATALLNLAALCRRYGFTNYASAAQADAARAGQPVSTLTLQAVLWAAYGLASRTSTDGTATNLHSGSPASYSFAADASRPVVGSRAPMPTDGITSGISCTGTSGTGTTGDLNVRGVAATSPWLVVLLIGATAATGLVLMTYARKQQGEGRW